MTKGQRAMAVAKIFPEATAYKRGGSDSSVSEELKVAKVSDTRISMARTVLKWAPEMAP